MILRILVIDQQFSVFPISQRLVLSCADDVEPAPPSFGRFAEDVVDFFERAVGGLGVEEVDYGEDEGVSVRGQRC